MRKIGFSTRSTFGYIDPEHLPKFKKPKSQVCYYMFFTIFLLDFSVDETCCNNATAICIEQHWFPSLLNRSTQNNRMDVDTPTIRHLSTIQGK